MPPARTFRAVRVIIIAAAFSFVAASAASTPAAIVATEVIKPQAPYPECHASTIVELTSGALAAAWFGGTKERHPDVGIWFARREAGGWQTAVEVANGVKSDGPRQPTWNPVLFQAPNGPLFLFYKTGPSPSTWKGRVITSPDGGRTWSAPRDLPEEIIGPVKNKPIVLADGSWLSGSSTEGNRDGWLLHFERSTDAGATWERTAPVEKGPSFDAIQPSILVHRDGRLQALARTKQGVIAQTWSRDGGKTWSALTAIDLPNPNSGTDALTLRDGRHLLVYNHSGHRANEAKGDRYPLDIALSADGLHWTRVLTLESEPIGSGYAYPAVIQTSDNAVHVTYTFNRKAIKHVVIDPKQLPALDVATATPAAAH